MLKAGINKTPAIATAAVLGGITGCWMVTDGIHRLVFGDYFRFRGELGPWAQILSAAGINPMDLGIPFVLIGLLWLVAVIALLIRRPWAWPLTTSMAAVSLLYCCIGTILATVILILLLLKSTRSALTKARG